MVYPVLAILAAAAVSAVNLSTIRRIRDMSGITMVGLACFPVGFVFLIFYSGWMCVATSPATTHLYCSIPLTAFAIGANAVSFFREGDRTVLRLILVNIALWVLIGGGVSWWIWLETHDEFAALSGMA